MIPNYLRRWHDGLPDRGTRRSTSWKLGMEAVDDGIIWEHARKTQAVVVSKDEDFADRWLLHDEGVALVWIRKGNCSNAALMAWLEPWWPETLKRLEQGETFIELRA